MAISIEDIKKLRTMTGAGLADVKKALKLQTVVFLQRLLMASLLSSP